MKKLIIILILIGFLSTSDQPDIAELRSDIKALFSTTMIDFAEGQLSLSSGLQQSIIGNMNALSVDEAEYLTSALSSIEQAKRFHTNYCKNNDFNPNIYGEKLNLVCQRLTTYLKI